MYLKGHSTVLPPELLGLVCTQFIATASDIKEKRVNGINKSPICLVTTMY